MIAKVRGQNSTLRAGLGTRTSSSSGTRVLRSWRASSRGELKQGVKTCEKSLGQQEGRSTVGSRARLQRRRSHGCSGKGWISWPCSRDALHSSPGFSFERAVGETAGFCPCSCALFLFRPQASGLALQVAAKPPLCLRCPQQAQASFANKQRQRVRLELTQQLLR